jgi:predicted acetyltransferase
MRANVQLRPVPFGDKAALWTMLTDYLVEHTARVEPGRDYDPSGYPYFDDYWTNPARHPYWIEVNGERAGFVLVSPYSPSELGTDHSISEFCVLPTARRGGVGLAAARAAFLAHPGQWELQVYRANPDGMPFWPKAIAAAAAHDLQQIERDDRLIYRFRIGP